MAVMYLDNCILAISQFQRVSLVSI